MGSLASALPNGPDAGDSQCQAGFAATSVCRIWSPLLAEGGGGQRAQRSKRVAASAWHREGGRGPRGGGSESGAAQCPGGWLVAAARSSSCHNETWIGANALARGGSESGAAQCRGGGWLPQREAPLAEACDSGDDAACEILEEADLAEACDIGDVMACETLSRAEEARLAEACDLGDFIACEAFFRREAEAGFFG